MTFQQVTLVGNLGKDPEMRFTASGDAVTSFSLATNRKYTSRSGEAVKETTWWRVSTWGKTAEVCNEYLHKGSLVMVIGRMVPDKKGGPRIWTTRDGEPAASFEVTATEVRFLSSKGDGNGHSEESDEYDQGAPGSDADEIPF